MQNVSFIFPTVPRRVAVRILALLALAMVVALSLSAVGSAYASGGGFHYGKWLVHLTFPNDEPLAELVTEIWYKPVNGTAVLVNTQTDELDCTTIGNLEINNEIASFTGQEYISCEQPDMAQKFEEVSQGTLTFSDYTVLTRSPFISGELAVAPSAPANVTLPTFYHPSIQHGLARVAGGHAKQAFQVDGAMSSSIAYSQAAPYSLHAEFQSRPSGIYRAKFTANGTTTLGTPANIGPNLEVNLEETTIYFGYLPTSNSYFQGNIKTFTADPGAFGRD